MVSGMSRLKLLRDERMLTQQELAFKSGLTITTISRIETGKVKPSFRTLRALAKVVGYSPIELRKIIESELK
jgi:transcriptional regulator with XRE-family HTH domain